MPIGRHNEARVSANVQLPPPKLPEKTPEFPFRDQKCVWAIKNGEKYVRNA